MALTFADIKGKLLAQVDILPPAMLGDLINDSLRDIYNENEWGFLVKKDIIRTPNIINTGTVSVTKFSENIILDATASAAILALNENDIPLIERQFRNAGVSANTGNAFTYNIIDFDPTDENAVILTLDQPYWDETNAASPYQILKIFYNPPYIEDTKQNQVIDFKCWKYFISLKLRRRLWTDTTLDILNKFDPARNFVDDPRHVVAHPPSSDDSFPIFELYPAPKFERIYQVIYQRRGLELINEKDVIPNSLDKELIISKAKRKAYEYVLGNMHKYPELKGSMGRFQSLLALANNPNDRSGYEQLLAKAIKKDEENYPKAYFGDYSRMPFIDSYIGTFPFLNEFEGSNDFPPFNVAILNF